MTFLICLHGESYHLDIEDLNDLASLADKYGWVKLDVDFKNMVITIHEGGNYNGTVLARICNQHRSTWQLDLFFHRKRFRFSGSSRRFIRGSISFKNYSPLL